MSSKFKVIDTLEEAVKYSQAGLLYWRLRHCRQENTYHLDQAGYFPRHSDQWYREQCAGFTYAILVEDEDTSDD